MQELEGQLLLSASDLVGFVDCAHQTRLDIEVLGGKVAIEDARDGNADLVARMGDEYEAAHLAALREAGRQVTQIETESGLDGLRAGAAATVAAMRAGAEVIYQGVLYDPGSGELGWRGNADFLERVERPSALGPWSYEVADTKLARRVKPYFLLQLCFYSEILAAGQGFVPESVHVILGNRERQSFRLAEFAAYYRAVKLRFEQAIRNGLAQTYPNPVDHCWLCRYNDHCSAQRERDDHPSVVAGITRIQTARLVERGISSAAALGAATAAERPAKIGEQTFERLRDQARLQVEQRTSGELRYELRAPEPDRGFARLPEPSAGDLYFDMEGDPFFNDLAGNGLEYLFGVTAIEAGEPVFRAFWATDRAGEKLAFERFIDYVAERRREHPGLHVYHYAPYEPTALKRLMGLHATREEEVDDLLRGEVLVDLYAVVRQALRIGEPSYSIKNVEHFYMADRETDVQGGGEATVAFEQYLHTGERARLDEIERYNEDDCRSTWLLHEWLLERRGEAIARSGEAIAWQTPRAEPERRPEDAELDDALRADLLAGLPLNAGDRSESEQARWLLAQLLDYHRREAKPQWWDYYDRLKADEEQLTERDSEALGGLADAGVDPRPLPRPSRSTIYTLSFPAQEHKIGPGGAIDPATEKGVTVERVDNERGLITLSRATKRDGEPLPAALIPGKPISTDAQRAALRRFASDLIERGPGSGERYAALRSILRSERPRSAAVAIGDRLQGAEFELGQAKRVAAGLDGSQLFIQGPPGSGKTYNGAHLICHLLDQGFRVGVASGSHAAIHNLLHEVERFAPDDAGWSGVKKHSSDDNRYESKLDVALIESSAEIGDFTGDAHRLIAGTAWLFARPELDSTLDYLFVDEAGQVSLADALAIGTSARNLVLLGDPLQLAQASQAIHPPGAGGSVLEHLLGDDVTIPPDRGLFIDQTRRMHPDVCEFVSAAFYEGRLESFGDCARQRIAAPGRLSGTGIRYLPVAHDANGRQSDEEAELIAACVTDLLAGAHRDAEGSERPIEAADIMVVSPYNAQVRCLREYLPDGVRVGTVDKFQGQEGVIAFFSMATSSDAELPRNLEFLFSRNRLNVAISRARCMAVLVCSPELLNARCRSAEQMRLVNSLCRLVESAATADPG